MLEKWKNIRDKGEFGIFMFIDLSKAFDTYNIDLLLPKLHEYSFSDKVLNLTCSYSKK